MISKEDVAEYSLISFEDTAEGLARVFHYGDVSLLSNLRGVKIVNYILQGNTHFLSGYGYLEEEEYDKRLADVFPILVIKSIHLSVERSDSRSSLYSKTNTFMSKLNLMRVNNKIGYRLAGKDRVCTVPKAVFYLDFLTIARELYPKHEDIFGIIYAKFVKYELQNVPSVEKGEWYEREEII